MQDYIASLIKTERPVVKKTYDFSASHDNVSTALTTATGFDGRSVPYRENPAGKRNLWPHVIEGRNHQTIREECPGLYVTSDELIDYDPRVFKVALAIQSLLDLVKRQR